MTTENSIATRERQTFGPHGIYTLSEGVTTVAAYDHLSNRTTQLRAMLDMLWGEGYESFKLYNEDTQSNFLWSCAELARECEQLTNALGSAVYKKADKI